MMKSQVSMRLPERGPDEPDITENQLGYIRHLLNEADADEFPIPLTSLGKWQASALIDRLQNIRDGVESDKIVIHDAQRTDNQAHSSNLLITIFIVIIVLLFILWVVFEKN